jgi:hypothetical protein
LALDASTASSKKYGSGGAIMVFLNVLRSAGNRRLLD